MSGTDRVVSQVTAYLRGLARRRASSVVTADDVQNFLNRKGFRGNQNERLSITRKVLAEPTFVADGITASARPEAKGRVITAWTLA